MNYKLYVQHAPMGDKPIKICYAWISTNRGDLAIPAGLNSLAAKSGIRDQIQFIPSSHNKAQFRDDIDLASNSLGAYISYLKTKRNYPLSRIVSGIELGFLLIIPSLYIKFINDSAAGYLKPVMDAEFILYNAGHLILSPNHVTNADVMVKDTSIILPGLLAYRLGIPYGFWGLSVGPITGNGLIIDRILLKGAEFIHTRESESIPSLRKMGIDDEKIEVVPDPAFHFEYDPESVDFEAVSRPVSGEYICMTVRRSGARRNVTIPDSEYEHYLDELASFVDKWYASRDEDIVFVSQHGSSAGYSDIKLVDSTVIRDLEDRTKANIQLPKVEEDLSIDELKFIYKNANGLIGTRFHSLIFAVQMGTPIIGISSKYTGPKIDGLMKDLGLNDYLFSMESLSADSLFRQTEKCIRDNNFDTLEHPNIDKSIDLFRTQIDISS